MKTGAFLAFVAGVALLTPATLFGELQALKNKEGKEIKVELVSVDETMIKAKHNGKLIRFPINVLAEKDQEVVRQWAKENVRYSLRLSAKKKMKDSNSDRSDSQKSLERIYAYDISVNNFGSEQVEELDVRYKIYTDGEVKEGNEYLSFIAAKDTEAFESENVSFTRKTTFTRTSGG